MLVTNVYGVRASGGTGKKKLLRSVAGVGSVAPHAVLISIFLETQNYNKVEALSPPCSWTGTGYSLVSVCYTG